MKKKKGAVRSAAVEYAALSEEEKQTEALYAVLEPLWMPMAQPISIQEYGTEDGWRVRKWRRVRGAVPNGHNSGHIGKRGRWADFCGWMKTA